MKTFKEFFLEGADVNTEHEIMNLYYDRNNYRIADIADMTGISPAGIYRILQKNSISPNRLKNGLNYETIYHYADAGVPARQISELTGYSIRQIYNILEKRRQGPTIPE